MSDEFEVGALASLGGLARSAPVDEAQDAAGKNACANCGQALSGRFCESCGQLASDFHRPIWTLTKEILSDAFSLDGRIARTVPSLMFKPGRVTRAYLEGKRARYVPPFRLFLLSSLIFFFTLFSIGNRMGLADGLYFMPLPDGGYSISFGTPEELGIEDEDGGFALTGDKFQEMVGARMDQNQDSDVDEEFISAAVKALENQRAIFMGVERWAPRLSFLILPIMALLLASAYAWVRRIYFYDHVITSLHFQSFAYLLGACILFAGLWIGGYAAWALLLLPVYLYRQMRVIYQSGRILSGIRAFVLFLLLVTCLFLVSVGATILGYMDLG